MNATEAHQAPALAAPSHRLVRAQLIAVAALFALAAAATASAASWAGLRPPAANLILAELARSGAAALPAAALLLAIAGFLGTAVLARARVRGDAQAIGRAARLPQALLVPAPALAASFLAWRLRPLLDTPLAPPATCYAIGAAAIAAAFPLLIIERQLAATQPRGLPEAPSLRALAFVAMGACFATGLLELACGFGLPFTARAGSLLALLLAAIGVELAARALGRLFLPPPEAHAARAACSSLLARLLSAGAGPGGVTAPIRAHLGIDFSRSWALAYARAAVWPMALGLGLLAWGLSGAILVPLDGRAIYQRFGAPVRVLHPGLHLILPWPMGTVRRLDFGAVHDLGLGETMAPPSPAAAEDLPPASADRLWEAPHPGEITLAIASASGSRQSFQSVSADLRILWRIGLTDKQAIAAGYGTNDPPALVRSLAGRAVAAYYADRTLDQVLGANREAMSEALRAAAQAALNRARCGLQIVAVVIEAIHPPAGAADAYHYVRAAEIAARTSIASERGNAIVIRSQSRQYATDQIDAARAAAAETVGAARVALTRFTADRTAAQAGGRAFLLERYFTDLSAAIARSPMTIIDHRLNWPEAPVLDLRPLAGQLPTGEKGE
jgi:regulator of protease activity HflC (stomatin/prohibitin superfamily)